MDAAEIYEKCKSRKLIILFHKSGLCAGYNTMERHRSDLAKYAVVFVQEKENAHDTAVTIFWKNLMNLCGDSWRMKCLWAMSKLSC